MTATAPTDAGALREALAQHLDPAAFRLAGQADYGPTGEAYGKARLAVAMERADALIAGPLASLLAARATTDADLAKAREENDHLRASLANSGGPCAYCNLPREDWAKCAEGFPGCPRGDDAMLCPHVGADLEARDRIAGLGAALRPFAEAAADLDEKDADHDHLWESPAAMNLTAGDLRGACSALSDGGRDASR